MLWIPGSLHNAEYAGNPSAKVHQELALAFDHVRLGNIPLLAVFPENHGDG